MNRYAIKRASGETLGYVLARDEHQAYDMAENQGLALHYVSLVSKIICPDTAQ